eukprot:6201795-Prymnesium_polylepis.2
MLLCLEQAVRIPGERRLIVGEREQRLVRLAVPAVLGGLAAFLQEGNPLSDRRHTSVSAWIATPKAARRASRQ